jgi:hypothetical protein
MIENQLSRTQSEIDLNDAIRVAEQAEINEAIDIICREEESERQKKNEGEWAEVKTRSKGRKELKQKEFASDL